MSTASNLLLLRRKRRIRKRLSGTGERPRVSLKLSGKHAYAQAIDDVKGVTLVASSSVSKAMREKGVKGNLTGVEQLAQAFGEAALSAGIREVVFDRNGKKYHGRVRAFADRLRTVGLVF